MPHDIVNGHIGHNHAADHLHSHLKPEDEAADIQVLCTQFIDGFRDAKDKAAYLKIANIPLEMPCTSGGPDLKLVDVSVTSEWQVGTASPSFGSPELSYLPFPGDMISERINMAFVYVSTKRREEMDLRQFLADKTQ
ncbi:hypothetical protein [Tateyamaria omphalii]|uniref:Uncharacterized protein n=1 Tax=Tateyamaria omphalii TaxID=299262 RepID=A0A1P8MY05_9RHOB|nr:hypothetical protein [Tateyamaria omphalii]APX12966.1 hypothetical protein BWR18_15700 [Tateyamaria omphalii]